MIGLQPLSGNVLPPLPLEPPAYGMGVHVEGAAGYSWAQPRKGEESPVFQPMLQAPDLEPKWGDF